jgi:hypothetical protein
MKRSPSSTPVLEAGEDLGLLLEQGHRAGIPVVEEQLDGYGSPQQDVLAPADLGHQALSEHVPQSVSAADESRRLDVRSSFLADRKTSTSRDAGLRSKLPFVSDVPSELS